MDVFMNTSAGSQRGIALVVALIFLVIISIIGISAVKFTATDVRGSLNAEYRVNSFQITQSVIDATASVKANTPVGASGGEELCTANYPIAGQSCDFGTIQLPANLFSTEVANGDVYATVIRLLPLLGPPPRAALGGGSSLNLFDAANFQISATHDQTEDGQGRTTIDQGLIVLIPKFGI